MPGEVVTQGWAARGTGVPEGEWMLLQQIGARLGSFEDGLGRDFKENCGKRYQQDRGFRQFRDAWTKAGPRDRDGVLYDAKKHWGSHLHIPLTYRTIEHMVPAAIAHAPKMLYLPRLERFAPNVRNVQLLMDSQMQQA